jgi:hypothetical protein
VDVLGGQNNIKLALHVDHGPLAERAGGYFQSRSSSMTHGRAVSRAIPLMNFSSRPYSDWRRNRQPLKLRQEGGRTLARTRPLALVDA